MATNVSNDILWYVKNFQDTWDDSYERSEILSLNFNAFSIILSSEYLNVENEYFVWKAIHDWVNFDKNSRLEHLPDLIENCLRFGRLEKHFIDIFIFECDLFIALPNAAQRGLKDFINNVLQTCQQSTAYKFTLSNSSYGAHFRPRVVSQQLLVCIDKYNGSVQFYDPQHKSWHSSPVSFLFPNKQYNYQLALLGSMLYAFGGMDNEDNALNLMWSRDLSDPSSQWTARANMKQGRYGFCSVVLNDTIYALGGRDYYNHSIRSCERYCSQLNEWSTVADMNRCMVAVQRYSDRSTASAAVINECIYVAGGKDGKMSVERYDPETDTWREVAPMTTQRYFFALTPFAGRLWAIGGVDGDDQPLSTCESYNPVTDTWREEAPMKAELWEEEEDRFEHAAIEFNGELYVVGGESRYNDKNVKKYVPNIQKWVEDSTLQNKIDYPQLLLIPPTCSSFFTTDPNQ